MQNGRPVLKEGGLLEASSNPGAATPEMLYRIYKDQAAATANPYVLTRHWREHRAQLRRDRGRVGGADQHEQRAAAAAQEERRGGRGRAAALDDWRRDAQERAAERESLLHQRASFSPAVSPLAPTPISVLGERRGRGDSPPRGHFVITHCAGSTAAAASRGRRGGAAAKSSTRAADGIGPTLNSLSMSRR